MENKSIKPFQCKILDMTYNQEINVFKMKINILEKDEEITLAIKGTDWGVNRNVPQDIIDKFCRDMVGQIKNMHVEIDPTDSTSVTKDDKGINKFEDITKVNDNMDNYPIAELDYERYKELTKQDEEWN